VSFLRRRRTLLALLVVLLIAAGIGLGIARSGGNERTSPRVLNQPTDARRVRPLRPGPAPGFGHPKLKYEKHDRGD
jgi:hypothetical protein